MSALAADPADRAIKPGSCICMRARGRKQTGNRGARAPIAVSVNSQRGRWFWRGYPEACLAGMAIGAVRGLPGGGRWPG